MVQTPNQTGRQFEFVFGSTMLGVKLFGAVALCGLLAIVDVSQAFKTVCYYDGRALWRKGIYKYMYKIFMTYIIYIIKIKCMNIDA